MNHEKWTWSASYPFSPAAFFVIRLFQQKSHWNKSLDALASSGF
jgi:hypothetical protein